MTSSILCAGADTQDDALLTPVAPFEVPRLRAVIKHSRPAIIEGTIIPLVVFVGVLQILGVWGAIVAGLIWAYGNILRRYLTGKKVQSVLVLGAALLTAHTVLALTLRSQFLYFLQPILITVLTATVFLLAVPFDRPWIQRLAGDFCPLPDHFLTNQHVRAAFQRVTLLWAASQYLTAVATLWLLYTQSTLVLVLVRPLVAIGLMLCVIALSVVHIKRVLVLRGLLVLPASAPVSQDRPSVVRT